MASKAVAFYFKRRRTKQKETLKVHFIPVSTYLSQVSASGSLKSNLESWRVRKDKGSVTKVDFLHEGYYCLPREGDVTSTIKQFCTEVFSPLKCVKYSNLPSPPALSESLAIFEKKKFLKIGNTSYVPPWREVSGQLDRFFQDNVIDDTSIDLFNIELDHLFKDLKLSSISLDSSYSLTDKTTNFGAPHHCNVSKRPELLDDYLVRAQSIIDDPVDNPEFSLPTQLFHRIQSNGANPSFRHVFCPPGSIRLVERMFVAPLTDYLKGITSFYKLENESLVNNQLKLMYQNFRYPLVSTDVANFDASLSHTFIELIFKKLISIFDDNPANELILSSMSDYLKHCTFLTPDGIMCGKKSGLISGSTFTSFIGCVTHFCVLQSFIVKFTGVRDNSMVMVMGDDGVLNCPSSVDSFSEFYKNFGFSSNSEKMWCHDDRSVVFCQKYYHFPDRLYTHSISRTVNSLFRSERFIGRKDYVYNNIVIYSKLLNIQHHPNFPILYRLFKLRKIICLNSSNIDFILSSNNLKAYIKVSNLNSFEKARFLAFSKKFKTTRLYYLIKNGFVS